MMTVDEIATALDGERNGDGWLCRCPVPGHGKGRGDRNRSLSLSASDNGKLLVRCHGGCDQGQLIEVMKARGLWPERDNTSANGKASRRIVNTFDYLDEKRELVFQVVRFLPKDFQQRTPDGKGGWTWSTKGVRRVLYRLPDLLKFEGTVYVVEGEQCVSAAVSIGLTATTSAGGSNGATKADWTSLAGRSVTILPDNDPPGRNYATTVADILRKLDPPATVKIVHLPDLPAGGDIVDFIEDHDSTEAADLVRWIESMPGAVVEAVVEAEPSEAEKCRPVTLARFDPFPVAVLPDPVRTLVSSGASAIGCDPSYIALPLLSAVSAAIGNSRRIQLKRGWCEPPTIWTAIVGESGTLKTPAFKLVMRPIRERQADAFKLHAEAQTRHEADVLHYDKALAKWKRDKDEDDPPVKPERPEAERFVVGDTTIEALAPILQHNPRGVLLARDELAGWIGSFDRYVGGRGGADAAHWLSTHNGESLTIDRKTGPMRTIYVSSASVAITGGIQPGILDRVLGAEYRESGLLARILLCWPPRRPKRWTESIISPQVEAAITLLFDRLYQLQPDQNDNGDPVPRIVRLSVDGKREWVKFYNEHAQEQSELSGDLAAAWSKLEGYAARLALVVHCVRDAGDEVDAESVRAGVTLSRWFAGEARRVYAAFAETDAERERRQLLDWITRQGGSVTARDATRHLSRFANVNDARAALESLVKAGFARRIDKELGKQGGRPSVRYKLTDNTDETETPIGGTVSGGFVGVGIVGGGEDTFQDTPETAGRSPE